MKCNLGLVSRDQDIPLKNSIMFDILDTQT